MYVCVFVIIYTDIQYISYLIFIKYNCLLDTFSVNSEKWSQHCIS